MLMLVSRARIMTFFSVSITSFWSFGWPVRYIGRKTTALKRVINIKKKAA